MSGIANEIPRFESNRVGVRFERDADRIAARCNRLELLAQHPPQHRDAAVALAKCSSEWTVTAPWLTCAS